MPRLTKVNLGTVSRFHFDLRNIKPNWAFPANVKPGNFNILLPPVLKNEVSNKRVRTRDSQCLEEMSVMFACWKRNDFIQHRCDKENLAYQACFKAAEARVAKRLADEAQGTYEATGNRYPTKIVNKFLRKYPQPKHKY